MKIKNKIVFLLFIILVLVVGFKKLDFFEDYGSTVVVETNYFFDKEDKELLKGDKIVGEFKARNNNLGIIAVNFNTHNIINDDYLQFSIKEKGKNEWYYSNKYKVDQFQNKKYFPFGFPELIDSKGKIYQIEIESLNGIEGNSVKVMVDGIPFLSKYGFSKTYLLQNKREIPVFMFTKIRSFLTHIKLIEYFWIIFSSLVFGVILKLIDFKKLLIFLKKKVKTSAKKNNLFLQKISKNKWVRFFGVIICVVILFFINWKINGQIKLKTLVLDDLGTWNFFDTNRNNFWSYVLNTGANKFRPVFNIIFFYLFTFFGTNIKMFGLFNLLFSFLIAILLFFLFHKLSKNGVISFCLSIVFIVSRFAYYDIGQALGVMEAMALFFSILLIYWVWKYFNTEEIKYFWFSWIMFLMLIFTHERFVTLLGLYFVLFFILGFNKCKNIWLFLLSSLPVVLNFYLKIFVLQIRSLDGTGGTNIIQTFDFFNFKELFFSGWLYLLGINAGPAYLNGIPKEAVPPNINILIWIGIGCLLLILGLFVLYLVKQNKKTLKKYLSNFILFFSFIFFTLIAASVTIRLEMRWLYVPLVGLFFLLAYIYRLIRKQNILVKIGFIAVIIWTGVTVPIELFYRTYYGNIYFWGWQTFANSLYENTLEKYGNDFWTYKTYIICSEKTSSFMLGCVDHGNVNLLFKQFEYKDNKSNIILTDDVSKIDLNKSKTLILMYDQQQSRFVDLELGKNLREAKLKDGWYGWDMNKVSIWTGKEAEVLFKTDDKGKMIFDGYIPKYNLPNNLSFFVDNKLVSKINIKKSDIYLEIVVPKNKIIDLKISIDNIKSPLEVGVNSDVRELGVLVKDIKFD
ncbi:MAG: hypothetical protein PHX34_02100 [Candidatus Shapirobacteria bacterium]|nr:hypothetical protein [Candidatus Shapirobacteria bacterium]